MKKGKRILHTLVVVLFLAVLAANAGPNWAAVEGPVTITGTITEDYDLKAEDGTVYKVAPGKVGDTMSATAGVKVKATGTVEIKGGEKVLTVTGYESAK